MSRRRGGKKRRVGKEGGRGMEGDSMVKES